MSVFCILYFVFCILYFCPSLHTLDLRSRGSMKFEGTSELNMFSTRAIGITHVSILYFVFCILYFVLLPFPPHFGPEVERLDEVRRYLRIKYVFYSSHRDHTCQYFVFCILYFVFCTSALPSTLWT